MSKILFLVLVLSFIVSLVLAQGYNDYGMIPSGRIANIGRNRGDRSRRGNNLRRGRGLNRYENRYSFKMNMCVAEKHGVNMRTGPGDEYPRIDILPFNTPVTIVATNENDAGKWGKLTNGLWVFMDQLMQQCQRLEGCHRPAPVFKQCDPKWSDERMVRTSICQYGGMISSLAMGMAARKVRIAGRWARPDILNMWLQDNRGYDRYGNVLYSHLKPLGIVFKQQTATSTDVAEAICDDNHLVILEMQIESRSGPFKKYALATGVSEDGENFLFNDPGKERNEIPIHEITNAFIFEVTSDDFLADAGNFEQQ